MIDLNFFKARRKARCALLQALYAWHMSRNAITAVEEFFLSSTFTKNIDLDYFQTLLHQIPANLSALDSSYSPYLGIKFVHLGIVEINILRIASYELLYMLEIPYKVTINEALELAKLFGADSSYKFINGVLDKLAKELNTAGIVDHATIKI